MGKLEKLTKQAAAHLDEGEAAELSVLGAYETKRMGQDTVRNGVLIATENRLVFYAKRMGGYDLESFPYENISSFEQGKNMMGGNVSFFASGNKVFVKWIKDGDLRGLVEYVRSRMGKKKPSDDNASAAPTESITDQLTKLGELRDAGVLTDDEFQAKKADLLGRM